MIKLTVFVIEAVLAGACILAFSCGVPAFGTLIGG